LEKRIQAYQLIMVFAVFVVGFFFVVETADAAAVPGLCVAAIQNCDLTFDESDFDPLAAVFAVSD